MPPQMRPHSDPIRCFKENTSVHCKSGGSFKLWWDGLQQFQKKKPHNGIETLGETQPKVTFQSHNLTLAKILLGAIISIVLSGKSSSSILHKAVLPSGCGGAKTPSTTANPLIKVMVTQLERSTCWLSPA